MKDVTAAIIQQEGSILIARRADGEKYAGFWEFPGGKVETGETPEQCLKRELFEEFGIQSDIRDFLAESIYEYPTGAIRLLAYHTEITEGAMKLCVHDQYQWVKPEDLLSYNLLPADISIAYKVMEVMR